MADDGARRQRGHRPPTQRACGHERVEPDLRPGARLNLHHNKGRHEAAKHARIGPQSFDRRNAAEMRCETGIVPEEFWRFDHALSDIDEKRGKPSKKETRFENGKVPPRRGRAYSLVAGQICLIENAAGG